MFCAWNAMCGTGLVTIPWVYQQSGIVLGIILTFVAFGFSFYTCFLVLKTAGNDIDYTDTLWKHFGRPGWTFGMISFIIMFTVPVVLLFQLLSQNLFPIILAAIEIFTGGNRELNLAPDWSEFSYSWTCVIIFLIVYVMGIPKDVSIYAKINSFGVVFITVILLFIFGLGFYSLSNTEYTTSEEVFDKYKEQYEIDKKT